MSCNCTSPAPTGPRKLATVQAGETTSDVARRYGVTTAALVAANPQLPLVIVGGQQVFARLSVGMLLALP